MSYDKTQKGNPHELTVNQHCFPARSIERFTDSKELVEVRLLSEDRIFKAKPDAKVFCARRAWDQRAESGFMKQIEGKYQSLADRVVAGNTSSLNQQQQLVVSEMFALWNTRWHWANSPVEDQEIQGATGVDVEYSKDEQERLEKAGFWVTRPDLTISRRHLTGIMIQKNIDLVVEQLSDAHWGILTCDDGEFFAPDTASTLRYVPVTPNICFYSNSLDKRMTSAELDVINREVISRASRYYFGRGLTSPQS